MALPQIDPLTHPNLKNLEDITKTATIVSVCGNAFIDASRLYIRGGYPSTREILRLSTEWFVCVQAARRFCE